MKKRNRSLEKMGPATKLRRLGPMLKELPDYEHVWKEWTEVIRNMIEEA
jgi:hypothetical protein